MTLQEFIDGKPIPATSLFGDWKERGKKEVTSESITKILQTWMLPHLKKAVKQKKVSFQNMSFEVKFKRDKSFGMMGETMRIYDENGNAIMDVIQNASGLSVKNTISEKEKEEDFSKNSKEKEIRSPKEIQAAIPLEERTMWTNYDLIDKINEEEAECGVKWWEMHNGNKEKSKKEKNK